MEQFDIDKLTFKDWVDIQSYIYNYNGEYFLTINYYDINIYKVAKLIKLEKVRYGRANIHYEYPNRVFNKYEDIIKEIETIHQTRKTEI